jgi:mitogen-activated protein kinase 7
MDEPSCSEPFTKWEQVESLETIQELREAISREIEEYRAEVRSLPTPDFSDMGEDEERSPEERHKAVLGESSGSVFNSPSVDQAGPASAAPSSADWEEGPGGLSSKIRRDSLSPENVKHALHHNDLGVSPTTKSSIPLPRSRSHSRHRDGLPVDKRERGSTPPTPATALSPVSESGPSSVPISGGGMSGRTSRRSSGYSGYGSSVPRRPNSFLFGGGGMTPMTSMAKAASSHNVNTNQSGYQDTFLPSATSTPSAVVHEVGEPSWVRSRSRAPSMAGQPLLIRQLSMVGLQDLGGDGVGSGAGEGDGHGLGRSGQEETIGLGLEIPPMRVSPSDAPASEVGRHKASARSMADGHT